MNSKQVRGLIGSAVVLPLSLVVLASSPAFAIVFKFCGDFINDAGNVVGKVNPSYIEVDDDTGDFLGFADITTEVFAGPNAGIRTYDAMNFVGREIAVDLLTGEDSFKYTFNWESSGPEVDRGNNFMVFLPQNIFLPPDQRPDLPITVTNIECRNDECLKDIDKVVPTPAHFIGVLSMLGFGGLKAKKKQLEEAEETA